MHFTRCANIAWTWSLGKTGSRYENHNAGLVLWVPPDSGIALTDNALPFHLTMLQRVRNHAGASYVKRMRDFKGREQQLAFNFLWRLGPKEANYLFLPSIPFPSMSPSPRIIEQNELRKAVVPILYHSPFCVRRRKKIKTFLHFEKIKMFLFL